MDWFFKAIWILFLVVQVQSGVIPEESVTEESYANAGPSSYQPQSSLYNSNQSQKPVTQQESYTDSYGNPVPHNSKEESAVEESDVNADSSSYQSQSTAYNSNQNYKSVAQQLSNADSYGNSFQHNLKEKSAAEEPDVNAEPSSYQSQSTTYNSNQNYKPLAQQVSNADNYGNSFQHNLQKSTVVQQTALQQSSVPQQQLSIGTQQVTNPLSFQRVQPESIAQSQYSSNQNTASNTQVINQLSTYDSSNYAKKGQDIVQNSPITFQQNTFDSQTPMNPRNFYNGYQDQGFQSNDQQNKDNIKEVARAQTYVDQDETKSKLSQKIPLVLITIQKNKNNSDKSRNKKISESGGKYGSQSSYSVTDSSENIESKSILNANDATQKSQNNHDSYPGETQSNAQVRSQNNQQTQYIQTQQSPIHFTPGSVSQSYDNQQTSFRYPTVESKKIEFSEWKPLERNGIRALNNVNTYSNSPQLSISQQSNFAQVQQRNLGYTPAFPLNANTAQASQQNVKTNYGGNLNDQQYKQNVQSNIPSSHQTDSNKDRNLDFQVTSTYVHQANINFQNNPNFNQAPVTKTDAGSQSYFVSNNKQGGNTGSSKQFTEQKPLISLTQPNIRNDQFTKNTNDNVVKGTYQGQTTYQANENKPTFSYGINENRGQSQASSGNLNINSNYGNAATQDTENKYVSNISPISQEKVNRNIVTSYSGDINKQTFSDQRVISQQTEQNNAQFARAVNNNAKKFEQEVYASNTFNTQPQITDFGRSTLSQVPITVSAQDNKNSGTSQAINYGSNQQLSYQNNVKPSQETIVNYSQNQRQQQNTYNTVQSINKGPSISSQNNNYQNNFKTVSQSIQNEVKPYEQTVQNIANFKNTNDAIQTTNQQNTATQDAFLKNDAKNSQFDQNVFQNQKQNVQNIGFFPVQGNRNNVFENTQKFNFGSNSQSNLSPNEYKSDSSGQRSYVNKEPVKQETISSNLNQNTFLASSSKTADNYGANTNRDSTNTGNIQNFQVPESKRNTVNPNFKINYDDAPNQGANVFRNSNYGSNSNSAANSYSNVLGTPLGYPKPNNYENAALPNQQSSPNNYRSSNYGSSESRNSVIGTNPGDKFSVNPSESNKQNFDATFQPSNENKQNDAYYVDGANDDFRKHEISRAKESAPEALLLVLVSAKKSAFDDSSNDRKDSIETGYESAPEEIAELLSDETNRKMILESFQEATNAAYREQEKMQERKLEAKAEEDSGDIEMH